MRMARRAQGRDRAYDPLSTRGSWSDRFYLWPFPYAETTQNPNLVQNTGW
jgi:hypothetical protein